MSADPRLDELTANYLDGDLDEADSESLQRRLRQRTQAHVFDQAMRLEALLYSAHCEPPAAALIVRKATMRLYSRRRTSHNWRIALAGAAMLLVSLTLAIFWRAAPTGAEVLRGQVAVNGTIVSYLPYGQTASVYGKKTARLKLTDGSIADFKPASQFSLRADSHKTSGARQIVKLESGKGTFRVKKNPRHFLVETSRGTVTVMGTVFSVELKNENAAVNLLVTVKTGRVQVQVGGETVPLRAGESRTWGSGDTHKSGEDEKEKEHASPSGENAWLKDLIGFSGKVRGEVVDKFDKEGRFTLKIFRVLNTWKDSKALNPQAAVGRTLHVGPDWVKDEGKWVKNNRHLHFIRKLDEGQEITLDIKHGEDAMFQIMELSGEQREWAEERNDEEELPENLERFSGEVRGVVVEKGKENTFLFKVLKVLQIRENNKAEGAGHLVNRTIKVRPKWTKDNRGKWSANERHVAFVRELREGNELTLEVRNDEGIFFTLQELPEGSHD